ncbi:hypothetical protein CR513_05452, partial [Mucuna pruriens]
MPRKQGEDREPQPTGGSLTVWPRRPKLGYTGLVKRRRPGQETQGMQQMQLNLHRRPTSGGIIPSSSTMIENQHSESASGYIMAKESDTRTAEGLPDPIP